MLESPLSVGLSRTQPLPPWCTALAYVVVLLTVPLLAIRGDVKSLVSSASPALPQLLFWLATLGGQAVSWLFLIMWMYPYLRTLLRELNFVRDVLVHGVVPTVAVSIPWLTIILFARRYEFPPQCIAHVRIFHLAGAVGLAVAAVGVCGMLLAYRGVASERTQNESPPARVIRLAQKASVIRQFLFSSAIVLGLGTIGTAALLRATDADRGVSLPSDYVILFGLMGTLSLLAAYAPLGLNVYRWGEAAIDEAVGPAPSGPKTIKDWIEARSALEKLMGQDATNLFGFSGILSAFLPLVVGSVGKLIRG